MNEAGKFQVNDPMETNYINADVHIRNAYDKGFEDYHLQRQSVIRYGIILIVLGIVAIISGIFNVYYAARIAQGVTSDLREDTYAKIQSFSFGNIEKFSAGSHQSLKCALNL